MVRENQTLRITRDELSAHYGPNHSIRVDGGMGDRIGGVQTHELGLWCDTCQQPLTDNYTRKKVC